MTYLVGGDNHIELDIVSDDQNNAKSGKSAARAAAKENKKKEKKKGRKTKKRYHKRWTQDQRATVKFTAILCLFSDKFTYYIQHTYLTT